MNNLSMPLRDRPLELFKNRLQDHLQFASQSPQCIKIMQEGNDRMSASNRTTESSQTDRTVAADFPSPRDLMRSRHPDLFSDSVVEERPILARPVFEYHLETLTARKEEYQFEHFCRLIAEKEICPNLRVQTGPTGGGDSKVDSETYPVAKEISKRWWLGEPSDSSERWAFAFSAKKAWKPKLEADVDNIFQLSATINESIFSRTSLSATNRGPVPRMC